MTDDKSVEVQSHELQKVDHEIIFEDSDDKKMLLGDQHTANVAGIGNVELKFTYVIALALSPSLFCKRYRSSYETPSSSLSLNLPIRKRYCGTSYLVEYTEDESLDLDTEGEGLEDEGPGSDEEEDDSTVYLDIEIDPRSCAPVQTPVSPEPSFVDEDEFLEEKATVTFGALWRPMLASESWAGHDDA
nr:hypothetical protein [Tanacetum cinerariifolium]